MPVTFDIIDNKVLGPLIFDGIEQGLEQGSRKVLRALLEKRFGVLPDWAELRLASCTSDEASDLALKAFDASSIGQVFGYTGKN